MNRRIRFQTSSFQTARAAIDRVFQRSRKRTRSDYHSFGWRVSLALAKCRGSRSRGLESRTPKNATAPSPESKISLDLQKHKTAQDSLRARTIARVPHRPSQHSPDSPVSKMASSMTMASAARCVPALARTTLALDARARTRPARWFPKREARGFFYRRCRGRRWIPGRDVACRSDPARRGNGDRTSEVVRRDARRERAAGASSPTRASPARKPSGSDAPNISIAPTPRLPCAKCHARPRRRDARRAERARSRRRVVSSAPGRRGARRRARGHARRPARGVRREHGTNNRTRRANAS